MNFFRSGLRFLSHLVFLAFVMSGCNASDEGNVGSKQEEARPAPAVSESKADTVEIKAMKFVPDVVHVSPGTTIVFINNDMVAHDVTEETSKAWSSNLLHPGKSWSIVADKSADYYCSIHVVMKGKITVAR